MRPDRTEVRDQLFVHLRWTNTVGLRYGRRWIAPWGRVSETRSACTGCDAEGVSCDTDEMATEYARANPTSNSTICGGQRAAHQGHHVSANTELRAGAVKVRRPRGSGVGAQRRTLHGAEHSSMLGRVMAPVSPRCQRTCRSHLRSCPRGGPCSRSEPAPDPIAIVAWIVVCSAADRRQDACVAN